MFSLQEVKRESAAQQRQQRIIHVWSDTKSHAVILQVRGKTIIFNSLLSE